MENGILIKQVEKMLSSKTPFEQIMSITGWSEDEIWMYMDVIFRVKHPEFVKNNKHYCVWGIDEEKVNVKKR